MSKPVKVVVKKDFTVPPEKIFNAWLDTEVLSQWMVGPDVHEEKIISLQTDPQPGGTFSFKVRRDGEELDHQGTYREVDRPHRLVFTWGVNEEAGDESVVSIDIEPTENGCRLTLVHVMDPKWEEYKERTKEGWTYMLDKLNDQLSNR